MSKAKARPTAGTITDRQRKAQVKKCTEAEAALDVDRFKMAELMQLPADSYKDLRTGRRVLRPIHERVQALLVAVKGTPQGEAFGV